MVKLCWKCGAPPKCPRCGSTDRRKDNGGCAECKRRAARKRHHRTRNPRLVPGLTLWETRLFRLLEPDQFTDIRITRPVRAYLKAFTRYLKAVQAGDTRQAREALAERHEALNTLEDA